MNPAPRRTARSSGGDGELDTRPHPQPPRRPLEQDLGFRLGRAHRALREAWGAQIADLDVTPPQAAMLRAVCERPGSGVRELGRRLHTDAMNAKRLADHLQATGLVESTGDPGHRQRRTLRPTRAGAALGAEVSARADGWNRTLACRLGPDGARTLNCLLDLLDELIGMPVDRPQRGDGG